MKKLVIEIEMNNYAFDENEGFEVSRILKEYADEIQEDSIDYFDSKLLDSLGNTVGSAVVKNMRRKKTF